MKKLAIGLASLLLFGLSTAYAAYIKVGVVDLPHILQTSAQVKTINKNLQNEFAPQRQRIIEAQNSLSTAAKQLAPDNAKKLTNAQRKDLQDKLTKQQKDLQDMIFAFQEKLNQAQSRAMETFMKSVDTTVQSIAKNDKLDMVLLKPAVIYSANTVDVTDKVVAQLPK